MPLYQSAFDLIRASFEEIAKGNKPKGIAIGKLTDRQLKEINQARQPTSRPFPRWLRK
jgi:hypothetical protein